MIKLLFFIVSIMAVNANASGDDVKINIRGLKNLLVFSDEDIQKGHNNVTYNLLDSGVENSPKTLEIYYHQLSLQLDAVFSDSTRVIIPFEFPVGMERTDAGILEKITNKYLIGQYDFDRDGSDEIVFGVIDPSSDGMSDVAINVYSYTPTLRKKHQGRVKNWDQLAQISAVGIIGDISILVDESSITIPRNLRGFYYEVTWVKYRFIDTGEF